METKKIEDHFQTLPSEILQHIFSFIEASQLLQLKLVCRMFKENCQHLIQLRYKAIRHHLKIFHQKSAYMLSHQEIFFCLNRMQTSNKVPNSLDAIHWLYMFLSERMSRTNDMCSHERDAMKTVLSLYQTNKWDRNEFNSFACQFICFRLQSSRTNFLTSIDQPFLEAIRVFTAKCSFNFIKEDEYRLIIGDIPLTEFDKMKSRVNDFIDRLVPDLLDTDVRNSQEVSVKEKRMGITILQEMMKFQLQEMYKKMKKNDQLHQELLKIHNKLNYAVLKTNF